MSNFRKVALLSALAFAGATSAHAQAASADASPTPDIAKASANFWLSSKIIRHLPDYSKIIDSSFLNKM